MGKATAKGTRAERAVASFLASHGHPRAERRAKAGNLDKGDIYDPFGTVWEVKDDKSLAIGKWLTQTRREKISAGADFGILVAKPPKVGHGRVGMWYTVMDSGDYMMLCALVGMEVSLELFGAFNKVALWEAFHTKKLYPLLVTSKGNTWVFDTLENVNLLLCRAGYGIEPG